MHAVSIKLKYIFLIKMYYIRESYRSEIGSCYAIGWNWGINLENIKTVEKISGMGLFYYVECHLLPIAVSCIQLLD